MKINLTVDAECRHGFTKEDGSKFLLPGQDFKPVNDLFESMKCDGYYVGPVIDDDLECNPGCPAEGSDVAILVTNFETSLPVTGVVMDLRLDGVGVLLATSDAAGFIRFNVPYGRYTYTLNLTGYEEKADVLTVENCINSTIAMVPIPVPVAIAPFNIHGFLTIPRDFDFVPGRYPLGQFFGVPLTPAIPPGNAYRTRWRLHTDACGFNIEYPVTGELDNSGHLLPGVTPPGEWSAYFDANTKEFVSNIGYAEGIYLQLGVLIDGAWTWAAPSPCIAGGDQTPIIP